MFTYLLYATYLLTLCNLLTYLFTYLLTLCKLLNTRTHVCVLIYTHTRTQTVSPLVTPLLYFTVFSSQAIYLNKSIAVYKDDSPLVSLWNTL
jgi:hypothetical protein